MEFKLIVRFVVYTISCVNFMSILLVGTDYLLNYVTGKFWNLPNKKRVFRNYLNFVYLCVVFM